MNRSLFAAVLVLGLVPAAHAQVYPSSGGGSYGLPKAENYKIRLEFRQTFPTVEGNLNKGPDGDTFDLKKDLGFEDKSSWEAHGALQFKPGFKITGSYLNIDQANNSVVLDSTLQYGGNRYFRDTAMATSMKGAYYAGDLEYDLMKGPKGYFGLTAGVRVMDVDVVLSAFETGQRNADTVRSILPAVGAVTRLYSGRLSFQGEVAGFSMGDRGHEIDAAGFARLHISDRLAVGGGYRAISHTGKDGEVELELRQSGWQWGAEISF